MPPFTYRLRFLIPRDRLPHTAEDEPHAIDLPPVGPIELHLRRGTGNRPDNLILSKRDIASADQALEEALDAKQALMRAGLIANVPMLFGNDASSTRLAPQLVDHVRATTGLTPRPDVHGIDILDEADGPTFALRFEAEGRVGTPIDTFLDTLTESLGTKQPSFMLDDRLALAIEVFMAASTERTPRARFLDFVTVLEVLAEQRPSSAEAITIVEAALAKLKERRGDLDDAEARSLEGSLARLRTAPSASRSETSPPVSTPTKLTDTGMATSTPSSAFATTRAHCWSTRGLRRTSPMWDSWPAASSSSCGT